MIEVGDVLKIVLEWAMPESTIMQVVQLYQLKTGSAQTEEDVLTAILTNLELAWQDILSLLHEDMLGSTAKLSVYDTTLDQWDEKANEQMNNFDGEGIGDMLPHSDAAVVRFFTAIGRRQGRKFISGLMEGTQVNGKLTIGAVADLLTFAAIWNNNVTEQGSIFTPGVFNQPTEDFEPFVAARAVNTVTGAQRRRTIGVGI